MLPLLFDVGSFSYNFPCHVVVSLLFWEFVLHASCCFPWGVSLTRPLLFYVVSFSHTPRTVLFGNFAYTPHAVLYGEFLLHVPVV